MSRPRAGPAEIGEGTGGGGGDVAGRALVICCGNALRGDDAAGEHVAALLAADPRVAAARTSVVACHQLTPDLADEIARAAHVVFVDACEDDVPGAVRVRPVPGTAGPASAWSHHVDPAVLLSLARAVYGAAPAAHVVSIGGATFSLAAPLSPAVAAAVPAAAAAVLALLAGDHGRG